jgi:hypothetical protein
MRTVAGPFLKDTVIGEKNVGSTVLLTSWRISPVLGLENCADNHAA